MPRLVLALRVVARHLRIVARQQQAHVLDRPRLADARRAVDQRPHDPVAQASDNQFVERLDRWRGNTVVARHKRVQRRIDWTRYLKRHDASHEHDGLKDLTCTDRKLSRTGTRAG